jgi:hypothetical protein
LLSFPEHQTLHTFLQLLYKIVKCGRAEHVRNVVDSEVIGSLREIFNDMPLFGGLVGKFASQLLAAIIHSEPTSYAALHESGLPQAYMRTVGEYIPPSAEFVIVIPTVYDAICINAQGKELFSQYNFEGFFRIFRSIPHCKVMTRAHCASDTGNGMNELVRHHPELKDIYLKSLIDMMKDVCGGLVFSEPPAGLKIPELADMTPTIGDEDTKRSLSKLNPGHDLTKARIEEEKNIPVLLLTRNVILVR